VCVCVEFMGWLWWEVRSCCVRCRRWQLVIHLPHATCLLRTAKKMKCYTTSLSHGSVGRRGQRPRTHTHKSIGLFGIWGLSPFAMSSNVMKRTDSKTEKEKNKYEKRKRAREREREMFRHAAFYFYYKTHFVCQQGFLSYTCIYLSGE